LTNEGGVSHISDDQSNHMFGQRAAISASHVNLSNTVGFTVPFQ